MNTNTSVPNNVQFKTKIEIMKKTIISMLFLAAIVSCKKKETKPVEPAPVTVNTHVKDTIYPFVGRWVRTSTMEYGDLNGVFIDSLIVTPDFINIDINQKGVIDFIYPYKWVNDKQIVLNKDGNNILLNVVYNVNQYRLVNNDLQFVWVINK